MSPHFQLQGEHSAVRANGHVPQESPVSTSGRFSTAYTPAKLWGSSVSFLSLSEPMGESLVLWFWVKGLGGGLLLYLWKESIPVNTFQKGCLNQTFLPKYFLILDFHPGDSFLVKLCVASQKDYSFRPAGGTAPHKYLFESFEVPIALHKLWIILFVGKIIIGKYLYKPSGHVITFLQVSEPCKFGRARLRQVQGEDGTSASSPVHLASRFPG